MTQEKSTHVTDLEERQERRYTVGVKENVPAEENRGQTPMTSSFSPLDTRKEVLGRTSLVESPTPKGLCI